MTDTQIGAESARDNSKSPCFRALEDVYLARNDLNHPDVESDDDMNFYGAVLHKALWAFLLTPATNALEVIQKLDEAQEHDTWNARDRNQVARLYKRLRSDLCSMVDKDAAQTRKIAELQVALALANRPAHK